MWNHLSRSCWVKRRIRRNTCRTSEFNPGIAHSFDRLLVSPNGEYPVVSSTGNVYAADFLGFLMKRIALYQSAIASQDDLTGSR